jgi:hypothetical protein
LAPSSFGSGEKSGLLHTPPTTTGWLMSPPMNMMATTSSISGSTYQPNFLPSIGVSSWAQ